MDHHGFLNVVRVVSMTLRDTRHKRESQTDWAWAVTPIVFPEARCPFCHEVARSPYIWLIEEHPKPRLVGAFKPMMGGKLEVVQPGHPHDTGGGYLCIGNHANVFSLFANEPNMGDCPMGTYRVPNWYKRYWNHTCVEGLEYIKEKASEYPQFLREYNQ